MGEALRAHVVAGTQLSKHGEQGVADQRVDLVDEEHNRHRCRFGPPAECLPQRRIWSVFGEHIGPNASKVRIAHGTRPRSEAAEDGTHGRMPVFPCGLRALHVHVNAPECAFGATVKQVAQGQQGRGLTRLPGRVKHEVALVPHQPQHFVEIETR